MLQELTVNFGEWIGLTRPCGRLQGCPVPVPIVPGAPIGDRLWPRVPARVSETNLL